MTAQELYEIVKDVPRDTCWPAGIGYSKCGFSEPVWISSCHYDESISFHEPSLAEAAFVGAMFSYQLHRGMRIPTVAMSGKYSLYSPELARWCYYDTLVAAFAAACKQKQEDDDGN